jgi:anti-anti-sigma regulatory factor
VNYRITEVGSWVVVQPSGAAQNNEPLRVRHLFRRWLAQPGVHVIINLKQLERFGVWEVGLLISFKKEIDQRAGGLRRCQLDPALVGYCHIARCTEQFEVYEDLESAMAGIRSEL